MLRDLLVPILVVAAIICVPIGVIGLIANYAQEVSCRNISAAMGVEYRYSFTIPCMVKVNGKFVPLDAYKVIQ